MRVAVLVALFILQVLHKATEILAQSVCLWKSFNHCLLAQQKRCNNNLNYNAFCNLDDTMARSATINEPSNGDVILNGTVTSTAGHLQIYYEEQLLPVCFQGFDEIAASTTCKQLGYNNALNYTSIDIIGSGATPVSVFSFVSCDPDLSHVLRCDYMISSSSQSCGRNNNVNLTCGSRADPYTGAVRLTSGTYRSRGLLEVYLNKQWGTVCSEFFNIDIGDVICRQLGYTNAVEFRNYQRVDNKRIVWLRDLDDCNTTDLTCFKECYDPPIIRNIYCGNVNDVELVCTFETYLVDIGSGNESDCKVVIKEVHIGIIVILIIVFCLVFIMYLVLFIGRFIIAAWHKSDRYKVQGSERRYQFTAYHEKLRKNSSQLSESGVANLQASLAAAGQQDTILERDESEDNISN